MLRKRSNQTTIETSESAANNDVEGATEPVSEHIDLFADHEDKQKKVKPMDEEKRLEQEKYEKQIGYLTYLGQDTNEANGTESWYNVARKPESSFDEAGDKIEIGLKSKNLHDPMTQFLKKPISKDITEKIKSSEMKKLPAIELSHIDLVKEKRNTKKERARKRSSSPERKHKRSKSRNKSKEKKKKHKKDKRKRRHSNDSSSDSASEQLRQHKQDILQKLRAERLQREKAEANRTKDFLREKFPALLPPEEPKNPVESSSNSVARVLPMKQKYNSQFNPYLAKQNYG